MFDFIKKLQSKPKHTRQLFAASSSAIVTLAIALIWFKTSDFNFGGEFVQGEREEFQANVITPFNVLRNDFSVALESVTSMFETEVESSGNDESVSTFYEDIGDYDPSNRVLIEPGQVSDSAEMPLNTASETSTPTEFDFTSLPQLTN